jgi:hypothetical protein
VDNAGDAWTFAGIVLLPVVGTGLLWLLVRYARQHPQRRKGAVLVAGNLLVFAVLLSALLLSFECYYRFWCDTTDSFGLDRVTKRWFERHYEVNASGIRDNVAGYFMRKRPGRLRVTFLGDSFTAGHGIPDVDDRFANRIRRQEHGWEVHVMALNGFDTGAEVTFLRQLLAKGYELDQVVLVYVLNDIADLDPEWQAILRRIYESDTPGFLATHSFALNTWHYRVKAWRDPDIADYYHFVLNAYNGPLWEEQKRRLTALRDLVASNGGQLRVVTFPFLHQPPTRYEYEAVHHKLSTLWLELEVPHFDLLTTYRQHQGADLVLNRHDAHPNRYAHELAADMIDRFLKANIAPADVRGAPPEGHRIQKTAR